MFYKKLIIGFLILAILGAVSFFGISQYRERAAQRRNQDQLASIRGLAKSGNPQLALRLLTENPPRFASDDIKTKWLEEEIGLSAQLRNMNRIEFWGNFAEEKVVNHHDAAYLWARLLLSQRKFPRVEAIIQSWMPRSDEPEIWFALKADELLLRGEIELAGQFLNSRTFEGERDLPRLLRLYILEQNDQEAGMAYLMEAFSKNSKNADTRSFLGQFFESQGKRFLAEREYVAAYLCDPENPIYLEQLFEYYLRHKKIHLAIDTLRASPSKGLVDTLWLKHLFYSRVVTGLPEELPALQMMGEMVEGPQLIDSKVRCFWNPSEESESFASGSRFQQRPEVAWLKLLQALKCERYEDAYKLLLVLTPNQRRLAPNLADTLEIILRTDLRSENSHIIAKRDPATAPIGTHPFFLDVLYHGQFGGMNPRAPTQQYVAAALLAEGWMEAALTFQTAHKAQHSRIVPDWYAFGMTQTLRYNRGMDEAATFAERFVHFPMVQVLLGEIEIARGNIQNAKDLLKDAAYHNHRAASLLAALYYSLGEEQQLKEHLNTHPNLMNSPEGQVLFSQLNTIGQPLANQ